MGEGAGTSEEESGGGNDESLDIAVVIRAVGFGHVHLAH